MAGLLAFAPSLLARRATTEATVPQVAGHGAVTSAPGPVQGKQAATLVEIADEITRQVSALRGLPQKTPFQRGVLSRTEIVKKLRERMAKEFTQEEVRVEAGMLKRLGLLPEGIDYEQTLLDMLAEQVAGFYDPYARTLYIADWLPIEMQRPALAHEIEHALQDQHFDLRKFSAPLKEDGDRQLAHSAVVEGDGTAVMLEYSRRAAGRTNAQMGEDMRRLGKQMMQLSMSATPAFQKAPAALRETLVFPYAAGLEFVLARLDGSRDGQAGDKVGTAAFSRVDELFRDPPDSTEQILHPEKYSPRERPVRITAAPISALSPRREVRRDVMGELVFKLWFDSQLPESQAAEAAAGWGGDRLVAYEGEGDTLPALVILSAWDSDSDAKEAELAARKVLMALAGVKEPANTSGRPPSVGPAGLFREKAGRSFGLARRGRLLLVLCGTPKGSEAKITDEVFNNFKVEWPSAK